MAETPPTIHDIADPTPLLPGVTLPTWLLVGGALAILILLLAGIILLVLRDKRPATTPIEDVYKISRDQLRALRDEAANFSVAEIATRASLAIRCYLAACLGEPALYETHEEFVLRDSALDMLPAGSRGRLNPLLEHLAEIKYGPSIEDATVSGGLVDDCLEVLQGLESTRPRSIE